MTKRIDQIENALNVALEVYAVFMGYKAINSLVRRLRNR